MQKSEILAHQIRFYVIDVIKNLGFGHTGGSLSIADLLAVIYQDYMNIKAENPQWKDRDYFVLSKGHGGPALYAVLGLKKFFPIEELYTLNSIGSNYPSHPDRLKTKGVDVTTGCLGQGLSIATGMALGLKLKQKPQKVFCVLGDGELNEGQNYEAMQSIIHHKLCNLITIVDYNEYQLDGKITDICKPHSFVKRFEGFGFTACEIDGHDHDKIKHVIDKSLESDTPCAIIAKTIKGKGFALLEENHSHHDKINSDDIKAAYQAATMTYKPFLDK